MFLGMDQPLPCSNIKQHIIKNNCFFIGIVENQIEMPFNTAVSSSNAHC